MRKRLIKVYSEKNSRISVPEGITKQIYTKRTHEEGEYLPWYFLLFRLTYEGMNWLGIMLMKSKIIDYRSQTHQNFSKAELPGCCKKQPANERSINLGNTQCIAVTGAGQCIRH